MEEPKTVNLISTKFSEFKVYYLFLHTQWQQKNYSSVMSHLPNWLHDSNEQCSPKCGNSICCH